MTLQHDTPLPSIEQRINSFGFGRAQIVYLVIGGILTFTRSCQMCIMCQLTTPAQKRLNLDPTQAGFLSTILFLGMVVGTMVSGHLGDLIGRRSPIRVGGVLVPILGCVSACHLNYPVLMVIRFLLGFFLAFGDVPLNALLNELTPTKWRIMMRSSNEIFYDLGFGFAASLAALQDPYLLDIDFTRLSLMATLPPGILAITTIFALPESPVFLASFGKMEDAKAVLANMRWLNRSPDEELDFEPPPQKHKAPDGMEGIRTIFGRRYLLLTFTLAFSTLIIKLFYYGGIYSEPLVLQEGHGLQPGWEIALGGPAQIVGAALSSFVVFYFSRQPVMIFAMSTAALGIFCFGFAGVSGSRNIFVQSMYHFGSMSFYWVEALAIIVLSQLAVEMYPTRVASTSGSVACAAGRIGCLIAPLAFEWMRAITGKWSPFCYAVAVGCLVSAGLFAFAWAPVHDEEAEESYDSKSDLTAPLNAQEKGITNFKADYNTNVDVIGSNDKNNAKLRKGY